MKSPSILLSIALVSSIFLASCNKSETTSSVANANEVIIKIGAAAPLTGPQAHIGKDNENGTRMAIEDANAKVI